MIGDIGLGGYNSYPTNLSVRSNNIEDLDPNKIKSLKRTGQIECESCKNRTYVDGSNESDVSFKAPGHISPESSRAVVASHEQEHVSNAVEKGSKPNAQLLSAKVSLQTSVCPECGTSYVSGGTTTTQIKYTNEDNHYQKDKKTQDESLIKGMNIDYAT